MGPTITRGGVGLSGTKDQVLTEKKGGGMERKYRGLVFLTYF